MYVNREGRDESVLCVEVKYVDVVYVNRAGGDESILYFENDRRRNCPPTHVGRPQHERDET